MTKKLSIAVIGCGRFARSFVELFKCHPYVEKVAVCDLIPEKATRTSAGVQIMQFTKKKGKIELATNRIESLGADIAKCKKTSIPSTGSILNQMTFKF